MTTRRGDDRGGNSLGIRPLKKLAKSHFPRQSLIKEIDHALFNAIPNHGLVKGMSGEGTQERHHARQG